MLQLKDITKTYGEKGKEQVKALKGLTLEFRKSEFVSILGQSGCGKTTFLNIIGGLDNYTSGDLIINGKSTKNFKDRDWDTYRNHSIGFVFQSYNLISHQSILNNVELALTLAGMEKSERRKRAEEALKTVGLGDKINKKPTELSGGQMQRVAIARALVGDPDILLADEPTGALDSTTSIQIMDLLKKIAKDRLVIMVTHNPEIAEKYSTRIIKLLDGKVIEDSNPYTASKEEIEEAIKNTEKPKKTYMKFKTALQLSLKNLLTKKGRTFLTGFAGSIGIIGIALILSLSNGMQTYINRVEEETLSSYPITLESSTIDMTSMMSSLMGENNKEIETEEGKIYTNPIVSDMLNTISAQVETNNLEEFKKFIEQGDSKIKDYINAVQYSYGLNLNVYRELEDGYKQINPSTVMDELGFGDLISARDNAMSSLSMGPAVSIMASANVWEEMIDNNDLLKSQYSLLAGKFPTAYNEVVLKVDSNNQISDYTLYSLGIKDSEELSDMMKKTNSEEEEKENSSIESYSYEELLNCNFKILLHTDYYKKENGIWKDMSNNEEYMKQMISDAEEIKIVGIIKPNDEAVSTKQETGTIGYTKELKEYVINKVNNSEIAKEQKEDKNINVLTGMEFKEDEKNNTFDYNSLSKEQKAYMSTLSNEEISELMATYSENASATYESVLKKLGIVDLENPEVINIYPKDFDSKEAISNIITDYNNKQTEEGKEENVINYTDTIGIMLSSVNSIINVITYALIAFVSISLVVSSIMIAIITYISVLERTKEIGILRSIGASKTDVSRVFNAETVIEGFFSGLLGIGITLLLNIPINLIVKSLVDVSNISILPVWGAITLVILSVILTVIAGIIPSKMAAKRDPAEALRSE